MSKIARALEFLRRELGLLTRKDVHRMHSEALHEIAVIHGIGKSWEVRHRETFINLGDEMELRRMQRHVKAE